MTSLFTKLFSGSGGGVNVASALYGFFGESAAYQATDSSPVISGLIVQIRRNDAIALERPSGARGERQTAELMISQSLLAKPVRGGRFMLGGSEVWTVDNSVTSQNGQYACTLSRSGVERLMERRAT